MVAAGLALMLGLPMVSDEFGLVQFTVFVAMAILALSQGFIWGYGGIMSFGQSAFFGIGGYAYAVAVINMGDSTVPALLSILCPPPSPHCWATSCSTAASATPMSGSSR